MFLQKSLKELFAVDKLTHRRAKLSPASRFVSIAGVLICPAAEAKAPLAAQVIGVRALRVVMEGCGPRRRCAAQVLGVRF
jgi:hypothetical protein